MKTAATTISPLFWPKSPTKRLISQTQRSPLEAALGWLFEFFRNDFLEIAENIYEGAGQVYAALVQENSRELERPSHERNADGASAETARISNQDAQFWNRRGPRAGRALGGMAGPRDASSAHRASARRDGRPTTRFARDVPRDAMSVVRAVWADGADGRAPRGGIKRRRSRPAIRAGSRGPASQ